MADDEHIFAVAVVLEEFLEVFKGGRGGECVGVQDLGFVAGFSAYQRCGLEGAFERA